MDTKGLDLPRNQYVAQFIDGMREVCAYAIEIDGYRARWDTVINGEQRTRFADPPFYGQRELNGRGQTIEEWLEEQRAISKGVFEAYEKGKV